MARLVAYTLPGHEQLLVPKWLHPTSYICRTPTPWLQTTGVGEGFLLYEVGSREQFPLSHYL